MTEVEDDMRAMQLAQPVQWDAQFTKNVRKWLASIELDVEPFLVRGRGVPIWVGVVYVAAWSQKDVLLTHIEHLKEPMVRAQWRAFMLVLERDEGTREAIEASWRLQGLTVPLTDDVREKFWELTDKLDAAPLATALKHVRTRREYRLSGRQVFDHEATRPTDDEFDAEGVEAIEEARRERPVQATEAERASRHHGVAAQGRQRRPH